MTGVIAPTVDRGYKGGIPTILRINRHTNLIYSNDVMHIPPASVSIFARDNATSITSQYGCLPANNYTLCNNEWNLGAGTGQQTVTLLSDYGNDVSWEVDWQWSGNENQVKTYPNVISNDVKGIMLKDIAKMPSVWKWEYTSESRDLAADVSYDIWLGPGREANPASGNSNEIMIWLSRRGMITPAGSEQNPNVEIANHNWSVYAGQVSTWYTISFVSNSGDLKNFKADLNEFFKWLSHNMGISDKLYVQDVQSGTEPFVGQAKLLTRKYSVSVTTTNP